MNVLNVVLSGIVTALLSLMTIKNFSKEELNVKKVLIYLSVYTVFLIISCFHFSGISRLLLNIIIMITSLYFSLFKKIFLIRFTIQLCIMYLLHSLKYYYL